MLAQQGGAGSFLKTFSERPRLHQQAQEGTCSQCSSGGSIGITTWGPRERRQRKAKGLSTLPTFKAGNCFLFPLSTFAVKGAGEVTPSLLCMPGADCWEIPTPSTEPSRSCAFQATIQNPEASQQTRTLHVSSMDQPLPLYTSGSFGRSVCSEPDAGRCAKRTGTVKKPPGFFHASSEAANTKALMLSAPCR